MSSSPEKDDGSTSTGFKSFWKGSSSSKSDKAAASGNVTFVQQDPSGGGGKKGGNRLSKLLKRGSTSTSGGDEGGSPGDGKTSAQKRRQQVYQAQKRHRNRKAEYVHNLEAEIACLQQMDAQAHVEKNALAHQNKAMKELLASHSLDFKFDHMNLVPESGSQSDDLSMLGGASIEVREDSQIGGKERTFLDWSADDEMLWSTTESSTVSPPRKITPEQPKQTTPIKGDSWAAVDFILALEYPCQDHLPHHGINPAAKPMLMETEDSPGFSGHQLTMTSFVYDAARSSSSSSDGSGGTATQHTHLSPHGQEPGKASGHQQGQAQEELKWQLPHTEIEKLVKMSSNLPIDDEEITPAQAYSAIRDSVLNEQMLKPCLDALKLPLSGIVECRGFGTVMPTEMFWEHLHSVLETLKLQGP